MPAAPRPGLSSVGGQRPKWAHVRIIKRVHRSAEADLRKAAGGPVRDDPEPDGPRAPTLHHVLVQDPVGLRVADSVPAWRIVRNYDRPVTCVPQRVRAMAIGPALPRDRDNNDPVLLDFSDHPHDHCPGRWPVWTDRGPAGDQVSATLPAAAIGQVVPAMAFVPIDPAKAVAVFDPDDLVKVALVFVPADPARVVAAFDLDVLVKAVAEFGPTDRAAVLGLAKTVADNKSARTVPVDRIDPMVVPIDLVDPVIVGPTWPTVQPSVAVIVLGDRIDPVTVPAATGGRRTMEAGIAPGDQMAIGAGTTTIITITGTMIGTIIGTTTTSTIITTTGITAVGAATGRTIGTCPPPLELVPGGWAQCRAFGVPARRTTTRITRSR